MSDAATAAALLKYTMHGPAWHGPAVLESLEAVSAEQAAQRPISNAHTIWEIATHALAWQDYAARALEAGVIGEMREEENGVRGEERGVRNFVVSGVFGVIVIRGIVALG